MIRARLWLPLAFAFGTTGYLDMIGSSSAVDTPDMASAPASPGGSGGGGSGDVNSPTQNNQGTFSFNRNGKASSQTNLTNGGFTQVSVVYTGR